MSVAHERGLYGNKPNWYRKNYSRNLREEVWVQHYELMTGDSFETGSAYSLHSTHRNALRFKSPFSWFVKTGNLSLAYVSPKTLGRILEQEKKRSAIFESRESGRK